jgi:hypothetical protein
VTKGWTAPDHAGVASRKKGVAASIQRELQLTIGGAKLDHLQTPDLSAVNELAGRSRTGEVTGDAARTLRYSG